MAKQIQSLERGLFILEAMVRDRGRITGAELARRLGVHKSTVSHLTSTLVEQGYLEKKETAGRFTAGPRLFAVARAVSATPELITAAGPLLERLATETGETAHLAELRGTSVLYLVNRYPASVLRVHTETGSVEPAHTTAVGKALLSGLPDAEVRALFAGDPPAGAAPNAVKSAAELLVQLAEVRNTGLAFDHEEQTVGTGCVACPVFGPLGNVVASVGVSGPAERVFAPGERVRERVRCCAAELSAAIRDGGNGEAR